MLLPLTKILNIILSFNLKFTLSQGQIQDLLAIISNQKSFFFSGLLKHLLFQSFQFSNLLNTEIMFLKCNIVGKT